MDYETMPLSAVKNILLHLYNRCVIITNMLQ